MRRKNATRHEHGTCPSCLQSIILTADGSLARHNRPDLYREAPPPDADVADLVRALGADRVLVPARCAGGGKRPAQA